jgi:hypothetical protein
LNPDLAERVTWIEQDLASFSWDGSICIAIGALNTFAYLNDSDFCSALKSVKTILMDQGLIVLDLPPDDADPTTLGGDDVPLDVFDDPEHGTSIELRARVTAHIDEQVDVSWIYDEIFPDGIVTEDTLHRLIHASGFTIRSTYGDYDASPYQGGSQRRLVILEKQNEGA